MKRNTNSVYLIFLGITALFCSCNSTEQQMWQHKLLSDNWKIQQADSIKQSGDVISSPELIADGWYNAQVPSTVMGALVKNGLYPNVLESKNMQDVDKTPFDSPWWYRTEFDLPALASSQHLFLNFDGLSYSANIWLNGQLIATRDSVYGTFRQFSFDITAYAKEKNILAVELFRAREGDPNIGFVDWNPRPSDESMGIFREVRLSIINDVRLTNTYVQPKVNIATLDEAWLMIETEIENLSDTVVEGKLIGAIESQTFDYNVVLAPREKKKVVLTSADIDKLHIRNPRLWWCNNLGNPELYDLELKFVADNKISSQESITFGIREIDTYMTERGDKGFILNGKKILIKGAGWTDQIFLNDTPETNEIQVRYVKDMNMNMIRFENIWGTSQNIYDLCDQYGLLALVGWSCHWEWDAYYGKPCDLEFGCIQTEDEMNLIADSFKDQVLWLRNHPSIIAWFAGSDLLPKPELEQRYMNILQDTDNRPYVGSAKSRMSTVSGPSGMKMTGPYEYVGPNYWYVDSLYGGAFGFNTETGIGAQLPIRESIERMIPADKLWPINDEWDYHCTTSGTAMNSLQVLTNVINQKYGEAKDLDDYLLKANLVNYDGTRAMFEAFRANMPKTTGITQWMLNSAWPSLYWQVYDYYLVPTSAYYSIKKANMPRQLIYNYGNNKIYGVNEQLENMEDATAVVKMYSMQSKLLFENKVSVTLKSNTSAHIFNLPKINENTFLFLELWDKNGKLIADNQYTLSTKQDEYVWDKTDWVHTPAKSFNDYHSLSDIAKVDIDCSVSNANKNLTLTLSNPTEQIAFFVNLKLKDNEGNIICPAFWSDNYVTLLPKSKTDLSCTVDNKAIGTKSMNIELSGWNVSKKIVSID